VTGGQRHWTLQTDTQTTLNQHTITHTCYTVESSCRGDVVLALPKYVVGWVPAQRWDGSPQLHILSPAMVQ